MFAKKQKIILYINNQSLTAGLWLGSKLQVYKTFKNKDEEHTAFSRYLAEFTDVDVYIIADAIEEDYKLEALPHAIGKARKELVERKLGQFNRNSIFRTAHFVNRDSNKRKDDNFLFIALNNVGFMQGWMDVIQSNHAPLVGVYLLPMISQQIVRQMKLMAPNILLCECLSSGLRQTFLYNGRVRMSRLASMKNVQPNNMAYFYLVEIEKTRLYLLSQRLISTDTPLQVVLPATGNAQQEIAKSINQDQGFECKTIDIITYAKDRSLAAETVTAHPELLHMQLLANGHVPDNLAPASFTKTHNLNKICRTINLSTAVLLIISVAYAGFSFYQGYQQKNKINQIAINTQQFQQQYNEVSQDFPFTPIPGQDLKVASEIATIVAQNNNTPKQFMGVISQAFAASPNVALNRIRWVQSQTADINDENADNIVKSNSNTQAVSTADPSKLLQIAFINAEIRGFSGDYRAALETASTLAVNLRGNTLVEQVTVLQEPVNVSSFANLQGSTTDEDVSQRRAPAIFKLKVVLKPTNEGVTQ